MAVTGNKIVRCNIRPLANPVFTVTEYVVAAWPDEIQMINLLPSTVTLLIEISPGSLGEALTSADNMQSPSFPITAGSTSII